MSIKLGWGEYYRPNDDKEDSNESVQWHARLQFVETLENEYSLKDQVFGILYQEFCVLVNAILDLKSSHESILIPKDISYRDALKNILSWNSMSDYVGVLPPITELTKEEKLRGSNPNLDAYNEYFKNNVNSFWKMQVMSLARNVQCLAYTYNLGDQVWFYQMVIILFWRKALKKREVWTLPFGYMQPVLDFLPTNKALQDNAVSAESSSKTLKEGKTLSFKTRDWNPILEKREIAKARILSTFTKVLDDHFDVKSLCCETIGYKRVPEKRNPEHFKWLMQYIIQGHDYEKIAQSVTDADPDGNRAIGTDAVRKAIISTAELIGINLRK